MSSTNRCEGGFSITELVVVAMVLAVLAAFAIPRFASLEAEAHRAAVQSLAGGLRSSAALAHSLWLVQDRPATVAIDGNTIHMVNGYPDRATIDETIADPESSGFDYQQTSGRFSRKNASTTGACSVVYTEALTNGAPTITSTVTGC